MGGIKWYRILNYLVFFSQIKEQIGFIKGSLWMINYEMHSCWW